MTTDGGESLITALWREDCEAPQGVVFGDEVTIPSSVFLERKRQRGGRLQWWHVPEAASSVPDDEVCDVF